MANFPSSLDDSISIPVESAGTPLSTNHVSSHTAMRAAIIALETIIGITGSAVNTTFTYILSEITGGDLAVGKTATQTLQNKTLGSGTKINLGTVANGDIYYGNGTGVLQRLAASTNGFILKLAAGVPVWAAETVVVAATESQEGIGRIALASQIDAGTASESSYPLFITPDQLALSKPTFNGLNVSKASSLIVAAYTDVTTTSNTTETTLVTGTIPANMLGTSGAVRIKLYISSLSNTSTGTAWTLRLKYGGSTVIAYAPQIAWSSLGAYIEIVLMASGATNTQEGMITTIVGTNGPVVTSGTSAVDSTVDQTLTISSQFSNSSAADAITMKMATIERI
jgi:hypothetical protein